jgi:SAM-dependent methyltransferase
MLFFLWPFHRRKQPAPPQPWTRTPQAAASEAMKRRYLHEAEYLLPKDNEEGLRLNFQHQAMYLTLGNHYLAPIPPTVRTILDIGTGTGIWCCEMARLFPEALVLGLDLDPALFSKTPPPHCFLRSGNVLTGLPLPDQLFAFTHQRFLVLAIPDEQWPRVIQELVRVTQVGGWIELVETDARIQDGGPATEQLLAHVETLREHRGLKGDPVLHLGELLRSAGVQDIEMQEIPLKIGSWGGRAGHMMELDILTAVQALKEPCCAKCGIEGQDFDDLVQRMGAEWRAMHPFCRIYAAYGRRAAP